MGDTEGMKRPSSLDGLASVVVAAVVCGAFAARARPDDPNDGQFTFDAGDDVLIHDTARFRFHYTVAGNHSVPVADADTSGVPDHVEDLGDIYEDALTFYVGEGFLAPLSDASAVDNGGDNRFDVYLVDFALSADGAYRAEACTGDVCFGYMVQENDFRGYSYPSARIGNLTVGSHELFHAVQAAYDVDQGSTLAEGTAVWASEQFAPSLFDLEGFSYGYLDDAESPLDTPSGGPVDPFSYGSGIFFQYLSERFGDDVVLHILEATKDGARGVANPFWFDELDGVLNESEGANFDDVFADFAVATVFTGRRFSDQGDLSFAHGDDFSEREPEPRELPINDERFVVFTSSSRLLRMVASGRNSVHIAVTSTDPAQTEGIRTVLIAQDENSGAVRVANGAGDTDAASVDVTADDTVYALVINTRREGQGGRPRLCLGDASEVDDCLATSTAEGEGEGEGDGDDVDLSGGGCHCSGVSDSGVFGIALVALAAGRRRFAFGSVVGQRHA